MTDREYSTGTRSNIPDRENLHTIWVQGHEYLRRWYLFGKARRRQFPRARVRWGWLPFTVHRHEFLLSDLDPHLHSHPWWAISVITEGEYVEHTKRGFRVRRPWSFRLIHPNFYHRVELRTPTVKTILVTFGKVAQWGFHVPRSEY